MPQLFLESDSKYLPVLTKELTMAASLDLSLTRPTSSWKPGYISDVVLPPARLREILYVPAEGKSSSGDTR